MRPTINLVKWKVFSLCFGFEGTISFIKLHPSHCRFSENLWWLRKRVYNLSKLVFLNYQVPFINFKFEVVGCDSRGFKANGIILSILSQVKVTRHDYSLKHWYSNSWNAVWGWYLRTTVANGHRYSLYVAVLCIKVMYIVNMQKLKRTKVKHECYFLQNISFMLWLTMQEYLRNET